MAREEISPAGLLKLPNEIFIEIATCLSTSQLRRLARASRQLYFFVYDYIYRYRQGSGLLALPNEIIVEIVQHLGSQKERSRFAQASQRLYPITMRYVVLHNVRYSGSSLLNYAAKRNLGRMAQGIIHLGGDVNTRFGILSLILGKRPTPLTVAVACGHERMVRILLQNGASHFISGQRVPLATAILQRHEKLALLLSQKVKSDELLHKESRETFLQAACVAKLVNLVRYYLERGGHIHDRNIALYRIIQHDASTGEFVKRNVHEDVHQIVLMLLKHGADPDKQINPHRSHLATARTIATRHPDPRVRALFPSIQSSPSPIRLSALIGRPWYWSDESDENDHWSKFDSTPLKATRDLCYVKLSDFLETSKTERQTQNDRDDFSYEAIGSRDSRLDAEDIQELLAQYKTANVKNTTEPTGPPPLSTFPRLPGTSTVNEEHTAKRLWANLPYRTSSAVPAIRNQDNVSVSTMPPKCQLQRNTTEADPFPLLVPPGPGSKDPAREIWGNFQQNRIRSNKRGDQGTIPPNESTSSKEGSKSNLTEKKKTKKKKWQPLIV